MKVEEIKVEEIKVEEIKVEEIKVKEIKMKEMEIQINVGFLNKIDFLTLSGNETQWYNRDYIPNGSDNGTYQNVSTLKAIGFIFRQDPS